MFQKLQNASGLPKKSCPCHKAMSATQQADAPTQCSERGTELRAQEQQLLKESSATERDIAKLQATADAHAERIAALEADEAEHAARRRTPGHAACLGGAKRPPRDPLGGACSVIHKQLKACSGGMGPTCGIRGL